MPYVTLMDLIANCPNELAAGSIIVYDWCHRVLQPIEHIDVDCEDIQNCIDCEYILSQLQFGPGFIVGGWKMPCLIGLDPSYINTVVTAEFDCKTGMLTIGNNAPIDLSCIADFRGFTFMDGLNNYTVANGDMIFVQWLHGMQCVVGNQLIQVDLPSGATNSQVLTWDAVNSVAYRANPLEICCDQIMDCVQPYIDGLQSQINVLSSLLCPCGWETPVYALSVADDGAVVDIHTQILDFIGDCWVLNVPLAWHVEVSLDPSCLTVTAQLPAENTVYVMKNGSDITWVVERFDLPFLTINAAISAAVAAGWRMTVVVHPWYYKETVELKNTVDVECMEWVQVEQVYVKDSQIKSRFRGRALIKWEKNKTRWVRIDPNASRSEIEVEADKIESTATDETYTFIRNEASLSRLKVRVGGLSCNPYNKWTLIFYQRGDGSSTDAVTGIYNEPVNTHVCYNIDQGWELYRHHSSVIRNDDTALWIDSCRNTNRSSKVYMDNIFIRSNISNWNEQALFYCEWWSDSKTIFNDVIIDLRSDLPWTWTKNYIIFSSNRSVVNFYWMNQMSGYHTVFDNGCLTGNHSTKVCNIFWRLLTTHNVNTGILNYYIHQGIRNYHIQTEYLIQPDMPNYTGYYQS